MMFIQPDRCSRFAMRSAGGGINDGPTLGGASPQGGGYRLAFVRFR